MAEPRIQYATTTDGVRIAFTTTGQGAPLVWLADPPWSHVQLERRLPGTQLIRLAAKRMLVRFDARGLGLSDREVDDLSLDARCLDVDAVANGLGLEVFDLVGIGFSGALAVAYAVAHPQRVSRVVLVNASARAADLAAAPRVRLLVEMAALDWEMFTENLSALALGWGRAESAQYGAFIRASVTPETFRRTFEAVRGDDVTEALPRLNAPTLVIQHSGFKLLSMDRGRELAAAIPNARLVVLEGSWADGIEPLLAAIDEFLGEGEPAAPPAEPTTAGAFRTVLFTDVEGSTALTQRLGDVRAREVLREHERIVREVLDQHGGTEIKTMGDGFMASFASATKALECAVALQRAMEEWNASLPARGEALEPRAEPRPPAHPSRTSGRAGGGAGATARRGVEPIRVRIGLNAGEPIAEEEDLFGTAVIVAARIAAQAQGGEILASNVVRELVAGKGFLFADRGEAVLRGFEDPVRLYEVRWRE